VDKHTKDAAAMADKVAAEREVNLASIQDDYEGALQDEAQVLKTLTP